MAVRRYLARDLLAEIARGAGTGVALTTPFGVETTDIITATGHGFIQNDAVEFTALTGGAGLVTNKTYYVIYLTTSTFKLAAYANGPAVDFTTAISAGNIRKADYCAILGLNNIDHSPSSTRADASGHDSAGRNLHIMAARGDSFTLAGHKLMDPVSGALDPGQAAVEAAGLLIGYSAEKSLRFSVKGADGMPIVGSPRWTVPVTFEVSGQLGKGGTNDVAAWSATAEVSGTPIIDVVA